MNAEIVTIGDELLIGQVVDTNSAWIGKQLTLAGIKVNRINSVSDSKTEIIAILNECLQRTNLVLITGGLGPTKDDITKHTLVEYFKASLVFNAEVYEDIEAFFKKMGKEVTPTNRKQAEVPSNCIPIRNKRGTAPAMWFQTSTNQVIVSMPGVPFEMKALMETEILPRLKSFFKCPMLYHKTILVQGIGESSLSDALEQWEANLARHNIKLAYLPSLGKVRLRLSVAGEHLETLKETIEKQIALAQPIIGKYIYGYENFGGEEPQLVNIVSDLLLKKSATIGTAESCTGGLIAHLLTSVPGSSQFYKGSVIAYSNEIKEGLLGIDPKIIKAFGTVSEQVVTQMAVNAKGQLRVDYAIAASGVAGPSGGTVDKPVGTVWVAIAGPDQFLLAKKFQFPGNRMQNISQTAEVSLGLLRKILLHEEVR